MKRITQAFVWALALGLVATGCSSPKESVESGKTPPIEGSIISVVAGLSVDGKTEHSGDRVWYTASSFVDGESLPGGFWTEVPEDGSLNAWVDADETLWIGCQPLDPKRFDANGCEIYIPPACLAGDCRYEFWVHKGGPVEQITTGTSWEQAPDDWVYGDFVWSDEFASANTYVQAYHAYNGDNYPGGPELEIRVDGDSLRTRGWVRRVKEDQGLEIEIDRGIQPGE